MCTLTEETTKLHADVQDNDKIHQMPTEFKKVKSKSDYKMHGMSVITNFTSFAIIHTLNALLLIALLPFMLWQWISTKDKLLAILKVTGEVTLELLMWIIFAGVSVVMATAFVMEDFYFGKNDTEKLKRAVIISKEDPATIAIASSTGFVLEGKSSQSSNVLERFAQDVHTAALELKDSVALKKKAAIDTVGAVVNAKLGVLNNIKNAKVQVVKNAVDAKLSKVEAIRNTKKNLLNLLLNKLAFLTSQNSGEWSKTTGHRQPYQQHESFSSGFHFPLFGLVKEAFSKVTGHWKKDFRKGDHIMIGDTEYIFVPAVPRQVLDVRANEGPNESSLAWNDENAQGYPQFLSHSTTTGAPVYGPPSATIDLQVPTYGVTKF
ncbi:hypothetical protein KM043_017488 [Ampulex compressa]|nr:hypothetical protein KM043_017488 [Ampulex compressa]